MCGFNPSHAIYLIPISKYVPCYVFWIYFQRFSSNKLYVYVSLFPDPRSRFIPDLYKSWASYLVPLCLVGPENGWRNPGKARADGWTGDVFHFEIYPRDLGAREAVYLEPGEDFVPQPKENRIVCLCLGVCHRVVPQLVRGCSCLTSVWRNKVGLFWYHVFVLVFGGYKVGELLVLAELVRVLFLV